MWDYRKYLTPGRGEGKSLYMDKNLRRCAYRIDADDLDVFRSVHDEMIKHVKEYEEKMFYQTCVIDFNGKVFKPDSIRIKEYTDALDNPRVIAIEMNGWDIVKRDAKYGLVVTPNVRPVKVSTYPNISKVVFNYPATIVFWSDGTKTVVKCMEGDEWDPYDGLTAAIAKKFFGNDIRKWIKNAEYFNIPDGGDDK